MRKNIGYSRSSEQGERSSMPNMDEKEKLMFGVPEQHKFWVSKKIDEALELAKEKLLSCKIHGTTLDYCDDCVQTIKDELNAKHDKEKREVWGVGKDAFGAECQRIRKKLEELKQDIVKLLNNSIPELRYTDIRNNITNRIEELKKETEKT